MPGRVGRDGSVSTRIVDSRGTRCPMPIIDLARAAAPEPPGTVMEVWATDPAADADVRAWCRMRGHTFLAAEQLDPQARRYTLRLNAAVG